MMRKKDLAAAFDGVTEAAQEQAGLSEVPSSPPAPAAESEPALAAVEPTPRTIAAGSKATDSATARFEARLAGGSQQSWKRMVVHGISIRLSEGDVNGTAQTTVRMGKPLREAARLVCGELDCTFEEFVRDALGMALERYSGTAERPRG